MFCIVIMIIFWSNYCSEDDVFDIKSLVFNKFFLTIGHLPTIIKFLYIYEDPKKFKPNDGKFSAVLVYTNFSKTVVWVRVTLKHCCSFLLILNSFEFPTGPRASTKHLILRVNSCVYCIVGSYVEQNSKINRRHWGWGPRFGVSWFVVS